MSNTKCVAENMFNKPFHSPKQNGLFFIAYVEGYVYIKKSKGGNTLRLFPFSLLNIQHILLKNKRT